jgi:hypothetical protein
MKLRHQTAFVDITKQAIKFVRINHVAVQVIPEMKTPKIDICGRNFELDNSKCQAIVSRKFRGMNNILQPQLK